MLDVKLLWTNISAMTAADLTEALNLVSRERTEKTLRFRNESDRKLSACAELLLKKALGTSDINIIYGENEKPYIEDGPYFNISHSGEIVICVVAEKEIGCDIEKIKDYNEKIPRRFFSENERKWIECQEDKAEAFFRIWTLKEAFVKATGQGLGQDLTEFSVIDGENIGLVGSRGKYYLKETDVCTGYRCSVCTEGSEITRITISELSISDLIRRTL